MIQNVQFEIESTKGYAYKLGLFNNLANPLPLTTGVNVLFGPNGCGKSTLLKMIGKYTTCVHNSEFEYIIDSETKQEKRKEYGWYRPHFLSTFNKLIFDDVDKVFPVYIPGVCGALELEWDGCPSYYEDFTRYAKREINDAVRRTVDLKTGKMTKINADSVFYGQPLESYRDARSRGESTLFLLQELEMALKSAPEVGLFCQEGYFKGKGELRVELWKEYILSRGPARGYTLLLDEPEAHLSIMAQQDVWKRLIKLSQQHTAQIIAASHSPLVLFLPQVNVIEFTPGYAEESRKTLQEIVGR